MAKATKSKKTEKEVAPEITQPEIVVPENEIVTPTEEIKVPEPVIEEIMPIEDVPVEYGEIHKLEVKELTMEEKLINFLDEKSGGGFIKINDFLKSLFPVPKFNEPPSYLQQGASKMFRNMLTLMQAEGKITIRDNNHLRLGTFHYPDHTTMKTEYFNIQNLPIEAAVKK